MNSLAKIACGSWLAILLSHAGAAVEPDTSITLSVAELEERTALHLEQGRYQAALDDLDVLGRERVDADPFLLRLRVFALVGVERWNAALQSADRLLNLEPDDEYGGFYRAQALAGLDRETAALRQLAKVVEQRPSGAAALLVEAEIPEIQESLDIEHLSVDRRISGWIRLGVGYDDNVALFPRGTSLPGPKASAFTQLRLGLNYQIWDQQIDQRPVSLNLAGSAFRNLYFERDLSQLEYTLLDLELPLGREARLFDRDLSMSIAPRFRYSWLGSSSFYSAPGARLAAWWEIYPGWRFHADYDVSLLSFSADPVVQEFDRDGLSQRVEAGLSGWVWDDRFWLGASWLFFDDDTRGSQLERSAHGLRLQAAVPLPGDFRLNLLGEYNEQRYKASIPAPSRNDQVWQYTASLQRPLPFFSGITASFSYTGIPSRSNQRFATYDRNIFLFELSHRF